MKGAKTTLSNIKQTYMKNSHRFLIVAAALALFVSANQTNAQSQPTSGDSIAASPKLRQMLDAQKARAAAPVFTPQVRAQSAISQVNVAVSPKDQEFRKEQMTRVAAPLWVGTAGYKATGADGITASPKARAMLDERRQSVEIAPLK